MFFLRQFKKAEYSGMYMYIHIQYITYACICVHMYMYNIHMYICTYYTEVIRTMRCLALTDQAANMQYL